MTFCLGVDPGNTGAAVLAESFSSDATICARAVWHWRPSRGKAGGWLVDVWSDDALMVECGRVRRSSLSAVATDIALDVRWLASGRVQLAFEGLYSGAGSKARGGAIVALCEAAGEVLGPLRSIAQGEVMRPLYTQWVAGVMRPAHGKPAKVAAKYMRENVHRRVTGLGELAKVDHVVDAACIAYWGAVKSGQLRRQ